MPDYVKRIAPKVLEGNDTADALYTVEAEEIGKLRGTARRVIDNCFIKTMDALGIQRTEELYEVKKNAYLTLDQRREIILNKILYRPPFTLRNLHNILSNVWGEGNYIWNFYPEDYRLIVDIDTNDPLIYLQFSNQVRKIIPANIYLILSIQWTHLYLGRNYTYERMEELTYGTLSEYKNLDDLPEIDTNGIIRRNTEWITRRT